MTKEELEKEAKTECFMLTVNTIGIDQRDVELAYVMSAEPREKRIAELTEQNTSLLTSVENLNESVQELEAQIEKMKCGQNCKHSYLYQEDRKCKFTYCDCINCKDKWELRR